MEATNTDIMWAIPVNEDNDNLLDQIDLSDLFNDANPVPSPDPAQAELIMEWGEIKAIPEPEFEDQLLIPDWTNEVPGKTKKRRKKSGKWKKLNIVEFLWIQLEDPDRDDVICWIEKSAGKFKILQPERLAYLWGTRPGPKPKPDLKYDNMA